MSSFGSTSRKVWVIGVVAVAAGVSALLVTHRPPEPAPGIGGEQVPVSAAKLAEVQQAAHHSYTGVVLARDAVDLAPKVDGTLESIAVNLGQHVVKGATVATIDVGPMQQDLQIAQAELSVARAQASKAITQHRHSKRQQERDKKIAEQLSEADLTRNLEDGEITSAAVREAIARVRQSQAKVNQLQDMVNEQQIRAPFDGVVTERYLATGARVSRQTPVVRLIGQNAFGVRFSVPGADAGKVQAGMPVRVEIDGSELALDGQVENVSPELDPSLQMLVAEAKLNTTNATAGHIPSGQSARIVVLGEPAGAQRR